MHKRFVAGIYSKFVVQAVLAWMVLGVSVAQATNNAQTLAQQASQYSQNTQSNWSMVTTLESDSSVMAQGTYEREAQTTLMLNPYYTVNRFWSFGAMGSVYHEDTGAQNAGFDNTSVYVSYSLPVSKSVTWINTLTGILPTNRELQDQTSYEGAVRGATSVNVANLFWRSSLYYSLSVTRNFHEYDMTADGGFNIEESVTNTAVWTLPLYRHFNLMTTFVYTEGWTYENDARGKFYAGLDLGWDYSKKLSFYIGTSNEGNAFKANGIDSNIQFYNDTSSVVKAGLTYTM